MAMLKEILPTRGIEIRAADDGATVVTGYAAVFNSDSVDFGDMVERVAPGAFAATLADGHDIYALADHDEARRLARRKNDSLALAEDAHGLRVSITLPDTSLGRDVAEEVRTGLLDAMSFGFYVRDQRWTETEDRIVRTLLDVELLEVSAVSFPAYPATSLEATRRSLVHWRTARQTSRAAISRCRRRLFRLEAADKLARG